MVYFVFKNVSNQLSFKKRFYSNFLILEQSKRDEGLNSRQFSQHPLAESLPNFKLKPWGPKGRFQNKNKKTKI